MRAPSSRRTAAWKRRHGFDNIDPKPNLDGAVRGIARGEWPRFVIPDPGRKP